MDYMEYCDYLKERGDAPFTEEEMEEMYLEYVLRMEGRENEYYEEL